MKKIIYTIVTALLIAIGFFIYSDGKKAEQSIPQSLRYENIDFGISFSYPKGYILSEREVGNGERAQYAITLIREEDAVPPEGGEGPTSINFDIFQNNLDKQSILNWMNGNAYSNFKLSDGTYSQTTVDGTGALRYSWDGLYPGRTIAFIHKDSIIAVSGTYLSPQDKIYTDFESVINSLDLR